MLAEELEKSLKNGNLNTMYLLYGEETFLLENCLKKIKSNFGTIVDGINFIKIDDTNIFDLISNIETPAFGFEKKLIIARNTGILKKETKKKESKNFTIQKNISEYLENNIDILKDSVIIVFIEEDVNKTELYKTIEKYGVICNFEKLKPAQIVKRLKAICMAYKVNVDESTLMYLIECSRNRYARFNKRNKKINRILRRKWNNR